MYQCTVRKKEEEKEVRTAIFTSLPSSHRACPPLQTASCYGSPCLRVTVSLCHRVYVSPCLCVTVSMCYRVYVSPCLCVTVSVCHRVYVSPCLVCYRVYVPPCLCVTVSLCQRVSVSAWVAAFSSHTRILRECWPFIPCLRFLLLLLLRLTRSR